jgi:probable phosphoglycerate mutase
MSGAVILVRHGETKLNREVAGADGERIRGWHDVPLHSKDNPGIGARIADKYSDVHAVYSSPLSRAKDTADHIAADLGRRVETTRHLLPWDLGALTGQRIQDVKEMLAFLVEHPKKTAPKGEPFDRFRKRYLSFLVDRLRSVARAGGNVVLVAHTRNVQLAMAWLKAGAKTDLSFDTARMLDYSDEVPPGDFVALTWEDTGP